MARYKVIKSKDHKYELMKKRSRIRETVDTIYVLLMLLGIIIAGLNQSNNIICGWTLIFMGIISIPTTLFHVHTDEKGWRPLLWYDAPEHRQYVSKETREKDMSDIKFFQVYLLIFLVLFSFGLPIAGILKVFEII